MWLNIEISGMICGMLTPVVVTTVQVGMIRIGLWEGLQEGELWAYINLIIFQYHCAMIFWSHTKCMTTEPGVLPKNYEELEIDKMSPDLASAILAVQQHVRKVDSGEKQLDEAKPQEDSQETEQ